jgi:hypothetical protein
MFCRQSAVSFATVVAAILLSSNSTRAGDPIRCSCQFAQSSGYSAVGTRAVCSTMTHKNPKGVGESCEIAFGAVANQEPLVSRLKLPLDPKKYSATAFVLTQANLTAVQDRNPGPITSAAFIREAIPVYMRAVYLRPEAGIDEGTLADLDRNVLDVSAEFAEKIAEVFQGRQGLFETTWRERHRLTVEQGAVRFVYAGEINLVAVFFDPRDQR